MGTEHLLSPIEKRRVVRRLELEAYASVVTAFRAQGPLTENKKGALELLSQHFSISPGRHRAEVRRAVSDDLLSVVAESKDWERQWRKEGQRLAPSNSRFTVRPNTHQSQVLTVSTLAAHPPKPRPKPQDDAVKPKEVSAEKVLSQRVQNVLKYIISQNPKGTLAKAQQLSTSSLKSPRRVQSAPPTPVKKQTVEKKLVSPSVLTSQLTKVLSPLKALVMGKASVSQAPVKRKEPESKTSGAKVGGLECSESLERSLVKDRASHDSKKSVSSGEVTSKVTEPKVKEVEPKVKEAEVKVKETEVKVKETEVKEAEPKVKETEVKEAEPKVEETEVKAEEAEVKVKETEVKEAEPKVEEAEVKEAEPKVEEAEHITVDKAGSICKEGDEKSEDSIDESAEPISTDSCVNGSGSELEQSKQSVKIDQPAAIEVPSVVSEDRTPRAEQYCDDSLTSQMETVDAVNTKSPPHPVVTASLETVTPQLRKRPAPTDAPSPVKKLALSLPPPEDTVEIKSLRQVDTLPLPSKDEAVPPPTTPDTLFSALTPDLGQSITQPDVPLAPETPTVDADQLLQTLSTESYNREESELASELGVDPSLLDLPDFMGIIHPDSMSLPATPTTPIVPHPLPILSTPLTGVPSPSAVNSPRSTVASPLTAVPETVTTSESRFGDFPLPQVSPTSLPLLPNMVTSLPIASSSEEPVTVKSRPSELSVPLLPLTLTEQAETGHTTLAEDVAISTPITIETTQFVPSETAPTSKETEVVQLTPKDLDILREMGLGDEGLGNIMGGANDDNLLEGIPQDVAATIQAIARIEGGDSVPWKQ